MRAVAVAFALVLVNFNVAAFTMAFVHSSSSKGRLHHLRRVPVAAAVSEGESILHTLDALKDLAYETVVIKYGGHAMGDPASRASFAKDVALLQAAHVRVVVVHGGGPVIASMLGKLGIETEFVNGMRVTDQATVEVAEMALSGLLNKRTVHEICLAGGSAIGLSGKDGMLMRCAPLDPALGLVGDPKDINVELLRNLLDGNLVPVIAPIGVGLEGDESTYNVNADVAASVVATSLQAARLLLLTDVPGVLDAGKALLPRLSPADVERLVADGTISGGMIPKCTMAVDAAEAGVGQAVILDGRIDHAVLLSLLGKGHQAGTAFSTAR